MSLDNYVTVGRSGLRVSPLCLGGMTFGQEVAWGASVEESQKMMDYYLEHGGNFLDTANLYTKTHSEKIIGDHVGRHPQKRDRLVLATKFSANLYPGDPNGGGSNRKAIIEQCHQSLRRLQTDYIDLYWLHNWDKHTPIEETMSALDALVQAGKVRYIGVSDTPAWKVVQANLLAGFRGWSSFIGMQIEYSLLERTVEQELVPMANELGIGILPWSPLKTGVLSGKYTRETAGQQNDDDRASASPLLTDKTYNLIEAMQVVAKNHDATVAQVALAWVLHQAGVNSLVIGARTVAQLEDNINSTDLKLDQAELDHLSELTKPEFGFPQNTESLFPSVYQAGVSINGVYAEPHSIQKGDKLY